MPTQDSSSPIPKRSSFSRDASGPIGIFDSGVGGVSIYKIIKNVLPRENYIYLADKKFFPYGTKSTETIFKRTSKAIKWLMDQNVKLIVIACNTATVETIERVRTKYPEILFVGTVPVIKTCAAETRNGNIGILCTEKTADSKYQKALIEKFAKYKNVYAQTCPHLVNIIEEGNIENIKTSPFVLRPIEKLKAKNVDTIALGCSHFPLIGYEIQKIAGRKIHVLDSGSAIARRVKTVLKKNLILHRQKNTGSTTFYTTAYAKKFDKIVSVYIHERAKSRLAKI
ncbi:MAG: glutamate racemase [Candidatus Spechtbacteria bacterium RIFCSPLOWO2_01_FULL_43_12]|uniref:Glutamate racemase n=1 Tax=Candidatus Spechtbacteria bacterium RIFCSPLOWO2_01_FULL_43_12 TaxID=1802162 RepID=A0A1G2HFY7_9BACT|nr:MAG: glutamate racemase [Candidatus Spechtbacteria bacterium RIFCSPLOWO2_01_FULL_43_12]